MSHTAELISESVRELLLGNIANTDAQMLSRGSPRWGSTSTTTPWWDNPGRLRSAVELARSRADLIITTEGWDPPVTT